MIEGFFKILCRFIKNIDVVEINVGVVDVFLSRLQVAGFSL